jgi:tetratricopeptide (TPR) repeat protein
MQTQTIHKEVLKVLQSRFKPSVVAGMLRELRRAAALERRLVGAGGGETYRRTRHEFSLSDRHYLDHVITFCNAKLKPWEAIGVVIAIGDIFRDHGDLIRAEELYTVGIMRGEEAGEESLVGEAYLRRGDLCSRQGRWKESTSDLNESRKIYRKLSDGQGVARVENVIGTNLALQGKLKKARQSYTRALAEFEKSEAKLMTGTVLMNLGIVYNILGSYDDAMGYYRRAHSYFDEVGNVQRLMELHHNMGMTYYFKAAYKDAMYEFDASIKLATKLHNVNILATASLGKASTCYQKNDPRLALIFVNQALHYYNISNDRNGIADSYKVKGMIHREMKQYSVALSFFQASLRINAELKNELNTAETHFEMGVLEVNRRNQRRAREVFAQALEHFTNVGASQEVARTEQELASLKKKSLQHA